MKLQGIKKTVLGGMYHIQGTADGFTVEDRQNRRTFFVEVSDGRWVGACSCGSPATIHSSSCLHQTLVRDFLNKRWCKPIIRRRQKWWP